MRRRFLTSVLLSLVLAVSVLFGSLVTVVADGGIQNITSSDFNKTDWEQNLSVVEPETMKFVPGGKDYATTVITNKEYSGSYSVSFKFQTDTTGLASYDPLQRVVALGAAKSTAVPLSATLEYYGTADDNTLYIGFSGNKIYVFDRTRSFYPRTLVDGGIDFGYALLGTTYWACIYDFYTSKGATLHSANIKLEVTNDVLKLYCSKSADALPVNPDTTVTLHKQGVADGCVQFSQSKTKAAAVSFKNVKINDTIVQSTDCTILGDPACFSFVAPSSAKLCDVNVENEYILSNFFVYDNGIAEGEEVFSLTYTERRFAAETDDHKWGLVLGVDESGDLSTGKEIKLNRRGAQEADATAGASLGVYYCTKTPAALIGITHQVVGYAGGKVELICSYNGNSRIAVYNNVDFNGKIAFKIFDNSGLEGGYWQVSNVSFNGQGSYTAIQSLAVTTIVDGVSTVNPVQQGGAFTPTAPTKAGEIFIGWNYTDSDETNVYKSKDFSIASVQESVTLEAIFVDLHIKGASVKTNGTQGLRFAAEISADDKAVLGGLGVEVKYGILLTNEENKNLDIPCQNWFNEEKTMYTAVLKDLQDQHANDKFTAKAYVEIGDVKYFSDAQTRSIAEVSKDAVNDYKAQSEGLYVYEVEGKWYKVDYTANDLKYINAWANKIEG
ncbi:MAG: hypothetical protein E7373_02610 [Clostridiales bacterium]|nr:hypothetical protein [Clostridiales bacterium]